jgi:hypothetical protein
MFKVRTNFQNLRMGFEGTAAAILGEMRTGIYPTWIAAITSIYCDYGAHMAHIHSSIDEFYNFLVPFVLC